MNTTPTSPPPPDWRGFLSPAHCFILCVVYHLALPLAPLAIERAVRPSVADETLLLTAALYPIAIGVSSRQGIQFFVAPIIAACFAFLFGLSIRDGSALPYAARAGWITIAIAFVVHAIERYDRHYVKEYPFPEFLEPRH